MGVAFVLQDACYSSKPRVAYAKTGEIARYTGLRRSHRLSKRSEIGRYTGVYRSHRLFKRSEIGGMYRYSDGRVVPATSGWEDILVNVTVGAWSGLRLAQRVVFWEAWESERFVLRVASRESTIEVPHIIRNMVVHVQCI